MTADSAGNTASVLLANGTKTTTAYGLEPITGVSLATQADALSAQVVSTATLMPSIRLPAPLEQTSAALGSLPMSHPLSPTSRRLPKLESPTQIRLRIRPCDPQQNPPEGGHRGARPGEPTTRVGSNAAPLIRSAAPFRLRGEAVLPATARLPAGFTIGLPVPPHLFQALRAGPPPDA